MIISALCIFSGDLPENNPDGAAEALTRAGYQIFRLSPEQKARLAVEGDDFIEICRNGNANDDYAMLADAERIVSPFGGMADDCGAASIEPFIGLFRA